MAKGHVMCEEYLVEEYLVEEYMEEQLKLFPLKEKGVNRKYEASQKNKLRDKRRLFSKFIEPEFLALCSIKKAAKKMPKEIISRENIEYFNQNVFFYGKPVEALSYCQGQYIGINKRKLLKRLSYHLPHKQVKVFMARKKSVSKKEVVLNLDFSVKKLPILERIRIYLPSEELKNISSIEELYFEKENNDLYEESMNNITSIDFYWEGEVSFNSHDKNWKVVEEKYRRNK